MDTELAGKAVIVTGATSNIGRAIALAFAAEGAKVAIIGRDEIQGGKVSEQAHSLGAADAVFIRADMTRADEVADMVQAVADRFGSIDVLVNNVGGNVDFGPFVESRRDQWHAEIDLNLITTFDCTQNVLPHMIERGSGRIINIGSTAGIVGDPLLAIYSATKGAIHAFTKVLAKEVGRHGITVNAIAPYGTMPDDPEAETSSGSRFHPSKGIFPRLMETRGEELGELARKGALSRSFAKPAEIGAAAIYLASAQAAFITGQVHCIEGGALL